MPEDTLTADVFDPEARPSPATVFAPPGASPIAPPARNPFAPDYNAEQVGQDVAMRKMLMGMGDAPIADAERAVTAALKFQAQRGYQRDLAGGMQAVDAFAKWGPTMFGGSPVAASAIGRAATPTPQRPINAGGVVYAPFDPKNPNAQLRRISPASTGKDFGAVQWLPVPGVPGAMYGTRPGSSAVHVTSTKQGGLTENERLKALKIAQELPKQIQAASELDPASPEYNAATNSIAMTRDFVNRTDPRKAVAAPSPMRAATPEAKLDAARALRKSHPDWSKKQILDAVNQ